MTVLTLTEASGHDRALLGGKGESLVRIRELGLPVPPAIIVTTDVSRRFEETGELDGPAWEAIVDRVRELERETGRGLGDPEAPLLVSVRSGAPVSMPGMMDTILNVGINDATLGRLRVELGEAADDSYERLRRSFARLGTELPQDVWAQLRTTVGTVLRSWSTPRAARYRRFAGIDPAIGTAVIVQAMVFGNATGASGAGVAFTRDPATGERGIYGDFLAGGQGDDVVDGEAAVGDLEVLRELAPDAASLLERACSALEASFADLCDIEFTVERGRLWVLQVRAGQRTALAAVRIALDLVDEGVIGWDDALRRIPPEALVRLLDPALDPDAPRELLGRGTAASPGAAVGRVALTPTEAEELAGDGGDPVILIRPTTTPHDIAGMVVAAGIVTAVGGRTSHAAVVARGMSKPAVCGVAGLTVDDGVACFGDREVRSGDLVSMDGASGAVYAGRLPLVEAEPDPRVERLLAHCDARRRVPLLDGDPPAGARVVALEDPDRAVGEVAAAVRSREPLVLRVPEVWPPALRTLPPGRWIGLAAGDRGRLAARLLAATLEPAR